MQAPSVFIQCECPLSQMEQARQTDPFHQLMCYILHFDLGFKVVFNDSALQQDCLNHLTALSQFFTAKRQDQDKGLWRIIEGSDDVAPGWRRDLYQECAPPVKSKIGFEPYATFKMVNAAHTKKQCND